MPKFSGRADGPVCADSSKDNLSAAKNPPRIAPCRPQDLHEIEALLQLCPEASIWPLGSLTDTFQNHPAHFFVAWHDNEIAGFISGRRAAGEGEILNLAVRPQSRRHHVGQSLVRALLNAFASEHVFQVFLEVRESNSRAIAFYNSLGFCQVGRRGGYYRNPAEAALVLALGKNS
ncbi:MAG: ribosomal protein S18-alanine N-acetyltransferase [Candidatus Acidiferrum sp.]